jgi:hypothetical protein
MDFWTSRRPAKAVAGISDFFRIPVYTGVRDRDLVRAFLIL